MVKKEKKNETKKNLGKRKTGKNAIISYVASVILRNAKFASFNYLCLWYFDEMMNISVGSLY
jgi:hypothetical protein